MSEPLPDQSPEKKNVEENAWRQFGRYSHLGFILPASIVVGLLIGAALDHWLKTSWITLVGLLVGCIAGFTELTRTILKASKDS
jgi:F0F1-type ATP synthase assembly protein I